MKGLRPSKYFWIALALMLALWIYPTWQTWNARHTDGATVYGFPMIFLAVGGECVERCDESLRVGALALDLLILLALPLVANFAPMLWRRGR